MINGASEAPTHLWQLSSTNWHRVCFYAVASFVFINDPRPMVAYCEPHLARECTLSRRSESLEELTMLTTTDRTDRRQLRYEELNRARQEIQNKWTEVERWHRRQLAECRQQALARLLANQMRDDSRRRQAV
jgi:hypothetical protein